MSTRFWGRLLVGVLIAGAMALFIYRWVLQPQSKWKDIQQAYKAHGLPTGIPDLIPPLIPEAEDFAMHPDFTRFFWMGRPQGTTNNFVNFGMLQFPWQTGRRSPFHLWWKDRNVRTNLSLQQIDQLENAPEENRPALYLEHLKPLEPDIQSLFDITRERSRARFPLLYPINLSTPLPHLSPLRRLTAVIAGHAVANLRTGEQDQAFKSTLVALRVSNLLKEEPLLISQLVRNSSLITALQPIWEGLNDHAWNAEQLSQLMKELKKCEVLSMVVTALSSDRVFITEMMTPQYVESQSGSKLAARLIPRRVYLSQKIRISELHMKYLLPSIDLQKRRFYPELAGKFQHEEEKRVGAMAGVIRKILPYHLGVTEYVVGSARTQSLLDLALVATALELYFIKNKNFPPDLNSLVPDYLDGIPHDLITGEPLIYRAGTNNTYQLYARGWNSTDDQGEIAFTSPKKNGSEL